MTLQELFSSKATWTKCTMARDNDGMEVSPNSDEASSFCLMGGIARCYPGEETYAIVKKVVEYIGWEPITNWNDACTTQFEDIQTLIRHLDI